MTTLPYTCGGTAQALTRLTRMNPRRLFLATITFAALSVGLPAHADALGDLQAFLKNVRQGKATFTQTVTSPLRQGETAPRVQTSSGVFEFQRPDRFRFQYSRPFEQTIVADGQTLWLYDPDLQQVTTRSQAEALAQTPAALIASAADVRALQDTFELGNAPDADGLRWVQALPKAKDGQIQSIRIGFQQGRLAALEILDSFGQRSQIRFGPMDTQAAFGPGHFRFQPPPGADVIRQ